MYTYPVRSSTTKVKLWIFFHSLYTNKFFLLISRQKLQLLDTLMFEWLSAPSVIDEQLAGIIHLQNYRRVYGSKSSTKPQITLIDADKNRFQPAPIHVHLEVVS